MKKILVIEDTQAEMKKAVEIGNSLGLEIISINPTVTESTEWMQAVEEADGIITDLFWQPHGTPGNNSPGGLLVLVHALAKQKSVVICTDINQTDKSRGHHGQLAGWIFDGYVKHVNAHHRLNHFGWEDNKSWESAFNLLLKGWSL